MQLTLIYHSVIMLLSFVIGSKVQDLSDICTDGRIYDNYLTFGMGKSDDFVSMLTTEKSFDCILHFSAKMENYVIIVLEFPDLKPGEKVCVFEEALKNLVILSDYSQGKNCQYTGYEPAFRSSSKEKLSIVLKTSFDISTIKITATSMRGLHDFQCFGNNETECMIADEVYCMTDKICCDGNINCGVPDTYDEDIIKCKGKSLTFLVQLSTFLMGILTILIFGSICLTLMPKRKQLFVYEGDQSEIFEDENNVTNAEIDIHILFAVNSEKMRMKD